MNLWIQFMLRKISEKEYLLAKSQKLAQKAEQLRAKRLALADKLRSM